MAHALNRLVRGDLSGLFDGPSTTRFDPGPTDGVARPVPHPGVGPPDRAGHDMRLDLDGAALIADPLRRPTLGHLRRGVATAPSSVAARPNAIAVEAVASLGIANLMVIHRLSDLDAVGEANSEARNLALGLLADCSTKIIYAQESSEAGRTAKTLACPAPKPRSYRSSCKERACGASRSEPSSCATCAHQASSSYSTRMRECWLIDRPSAWPRDWSVRWNRHPANRKSFIMQVTIDSTEPLERVLPVINVLMLLLAVRRKRCNKCGERPRPHSSCARESVPAAAGATQQASRDHRQRRPRVGT